VETNIESKAVEELAGAAAGLMNPAIEEWKAGGGTVIGHFCSHVPVGVMTAAGVLPFRMRGTGSTGTELADASFSSINCSFPKHTFNQALRGEFDFLDGLICISSCDHVRRIYDNWKQQLSTPYLTVMSLPKKNGEAQVEWYYEEINILRESLGKFLGVEITDDRLRDAIKQVNETRSLQRQMYELRKRERPPISGAEALAVMVAGNSLPRERYNDLLRTLLADLENVEGKSSYRARLMIVGSELDDPDYVQVIEDQGGLVVTDSICFGTRTMWVDCSETEPDPVRALARYYIQERPACPRMNGAQPARAQFVQDMVREFAVDGVVGERMLFCDFWCAEHYMNKADLKEAGIPFIQIDREYILSGKGQLQTRIQAFLETMGR